MSFGIYEIKRVLRTPLVWYGRRKYADADPMVKWRLEHNAYRKAGKQAMDNTAADPHHFHRADLGPDSVVVDVGAFRGLVAQEFVDLYGCTVHAFEPNPQFYEELEERFHDNPKVFTYDVGLGGADAVLAMEQRGLGSTVYGSNDDDSVPTVEVRIRDVATVLDELGYDQIDYIKINIEGAEYDLLDRLIETGWIARTRYFLIQFHEWYGHPHRRRWKIRRHLRTSHQEVWNYPWIYELWCATDRPHPEAPKYTKEEMVEIRAALRARRLAAEAAAAEAEAKAAAEAAAATAVGDAPGEQVRPADAGPA